LLETLAPLSFVILGLDLRIHSFQGLMDPRVKPEDDGREVWRALSATHGGFAARHVFSKRPKGRKTARMMLHRPTIALRISGPAFRAL